MSNRQPNAFHRAFPAREFFRGSARTVLFWSLVNGLLLILLLVDLFLIIDLLDHRGRITLHGEQNVKLLQELRTAPVRLPVEHEQAKSVPEPEKVRADGKSSVPGGEPEPKPSPIAEMPRLEMVSLTDSGILPSVWWTYSKYQIGLLPRIYQRVPLLQENQTALFTLICFALVVASIRVLIRWRSRQKSLTISHHVSMSLRNMIHRQALRLGPGDLSGKETEQAFQLFIRDVGTVQQGVFQWVYGQSRHPITLLILLLFAISIDWRLTLQCMIPLVAAWYFLLQHRKNYEQEQAKTLVAIETELSLLAENLRSTRLVRGFGMETAEHDQFQKHLQKYTENIATLKRVEGWGHRVARGLAVFCSCMVLFLVGYKVLVSPDSLPLSAAVLMTGIFAFFYLPVNGLYQLIEIRDEANIAASSIYRYLNQIPSVGQAVGAKFLEPLSQALQFENVSFQYPNSQQYALREVSLDIAPGETIALVGPSGAGKTTFCNLVARFYDPTSGRILLDGHDLIDFDVESYRNQIGVVEQDVFLFDGSIADNIGYGDRKATIEQIQYAAEIANADEFIRTLPNGYQTLIGERGVKLSGGQRQRLAIARAILADPKILILDEATSNLDTESERLIQDSLTTLMQNRTCFVIAHRLSTITHASRIVVFEGGRIIESGSHEILMETGGKYKEMVLLQTSPAEVS